MSIMGDSLNKWSKPKVSYLHQEEISILNPLDIQNRMQGHTQVIVEKSSVCQKLEQSVRAAMLDWCDESDKKYIEIGAAITEDWKLGEKVSGTKDQVAIHRPQGTIGIFHCLPYDTLVYVPGFGPMPAGEVANESHYAEELYEITTKNGGSIRTTGNHPFMVNPYTEEWRLASELKVGDKLHLETKLLVPECDDLTICDLPIPSRGPRLKYYPKLPTKLTPELGKLLGLLWSDGIVRDAIHSSGIYFTNSDDNLISMAHDLMLNLFGIEPTIYQTGYGAGKKVGICSKLLALYFTYVLGFNKQSIPKILWNASIPVRVAFLDGETLGDGSINNTKGNGKRNEVAVGPEHDTAVSLSYFISTLGYKPSIHLHQQNWYPHNYDYIYSVNYQCGNTRIKNGIVPITSIKIIPGHVKVYDIHTETGILYAGNLPYITHNTHPHGSDLPSPHDFIDTLDKKDKVSCIGGTGQYGNNVACYEPNEPFYTTLRNELETLDKAINIYTLKTQHKYRSKGRRLKRMLRSVSEGYYRDVQESVPDEVYEKKLVDANERVENTMSMLVIARSNLAAAREELKGIVRSPFSGEVTSGRDIDVAEENIKTATEGLVTNLRNYNNAVADKEEAEKVLFFRKATDKPALVAEVDAAKDLLREGAELEQRRIKLIQEINNQRQLIAYGCAGSNAGGWQCKGRPLAFKTCRVTRDYFEPSEEPGL